MDDVKAFVRFIINSPKYSGEDVRNYWYNEGPKALFVVCWLLINVGLVVAWVMLYYGTPSYDVFGPALLGVASPPPTDRPSHHPPAPPVSRGSAEALKFNCGLLLIPVLRNFLSYLRFSLLSLLSSCAHLWRQQGHGGRQLFAD